MAFCKNCGKKLPEDAFFCPSCGTKNEPVAEDAAPSEPTLPVDAKTDVAVRDNEAQPAPRKGGKGKLIAAAALVLVVGGGAAVFASGALAPKEPPAKQDVADGSKASSDETRGDHLVKTRYDDLEADDVVIADDVYARPGVRFKMKNNTGEVLKDAIVRVYGTYKVLDSYGDEQLKEDEISMVVAETGSTNIPRVLPGESTVELIPCDVDGVVGTHKSTYTGDEQQYRLEDMESVRVEVAFASRTGSEEYPELKKDDYKVDLTMMVNDYNNPLLKVRITNQTNYKWRMARVYTVGVAADGSIARRSGSSGVASAYDCTDRLFEYLNPGESKEVEVSYHGDLDVDHFEVTRVVVEKELGSESED